MTAAEARKIKWYVDPPPPPDQDPCPARHPDYPDTPCEWWLGHEVEDGCHTIVVRIDGEPEVITWEARK